jgi:hypothetical protein
MLQDLFRYTELQSYEKNLCLIEKRRFLLLLFYCYQEKSDAKRWILKKTVFYVMLVGSCIMNFHSKRAIG